MNEIINLLKEILSEVKAQRQTMQLMVETVDARAHDQRKAKMDIGKQINDLASKLEGSPFAQILRETAKVMEAKDGN